MSAEVEAAWMRRAIHHCEFWSSSTPSQASLRAAFTRRRQVNAPIAGWLPIGLRYRTISELRDALVELEADSRECAEAPRG